jgi:ABC-type long-subunit fatty acid transport system fused permease/ATPase subunit
VYGKECDFRTRESFPGVNDATEAVDEDVSRFNDIAESFGVGSLRIIYKDFANLPCLVRFISCYSWI